MNKTEFEVLSKSLTKGHLTQRQIANLCGCSLGTVNQALKSLREKSYLDASGNVTEEGKKALEPYKVRNAVIMAAGLSSRFAPISYERPKGVM